MSNQKNKDMVCLYIFTHNITGLKYFGKTTRYFTIKDLLKYKGSGKYWNNHLKIHGKDLSVEIYGIYHKDDVSEIALKFSEDNNIVKEINEVGKKVWANEKFENGLDGNVRGNEHSKFTKIKISNTKAKIPNDIKQESIRRHLMNTDRVAAEKKRLRTINEMKSKGIKFDFNSSKRKETLSRKKENGLTGFQENGIKISKALKGKVSILNIKNNIKFWGVQQEDYNNCWYLVGHTAKYITLHEIDGILYTEKGLNIDKNILLKDYYKITKNKPFKRIRIRIEEVHDNFEYYSSIISTNS